MARRFATTNRHYPSANTDAVVTYAAVSGKAHGIQKIWYSYDSTPTNGRIYVEDGSGTVVFDQDIATSGPGFVDFGEDVAGTDNTALIITLAAGGAGVTGKLNIVGYQLHNLIS